MLSRKRLKLRAIPRRALSRLFLTLPALCASVSLADEFIFVAAERAEGLELAPDLFERLRVAGDEADAVARAGEAAGDRAPDARGLSGDDNEADFGDSWLDRKGQGGQNSDADRASRAARAAPRSARRSG